MHGEDPLSSQIQYTPLHIFITYPDQFNIIDLNAVAAVPEPSTWALLLIGFAGIGFASYRAE
jgi:hypothetical protein